MSLMRLCLYITTPSTSILPCVLAGMISYRHLQLLCVTAEDSHFQRLSEKTSRFRLASLMVGSFRLHRFKARRTI